MPFSSTAHLWDIYEANALGPKLRRARFVRAISARGRRDLLAAVPGTPADRIGVLHVGVDVPETLPARPARAAGAPFTVLCAANLVRKKGHADLVRALARLRPFDKLRVTEDGPFDKLQGDGRACGLFWRGMASCAASSSGSCVSSGSPMR